MKKLIIIFSLLIGSLHLINGQKIDSTLIYFRALEYHYNMEEPTSDEPECNSNHLVVVPESISSNFPDTCCGYKLEILDYSTLSERRLNSRRNIDFLEVEQARISEKGIIIPIIYRIAVKKWRKVIIGIYIGFEYEIQVDKSNNSIKIKRLPHHLG